MSHKVCILGAGSVAAFIYAACKSYDINPDIYTKGTVRIPNGAFWYHWVPNYVDLEPETIRIYSVGDELGYVRKQWGDTVKVNPNSSSFPRSPKIVKGWNPSQAYPMIMRECNIIYTGMDQDDEYSRLKSEEYDLVFQTYPTRHHYEAKQEFIVTVSVLRRKKICSAA